MKQLKTTKLTLALAVVLGTVGAIETASADVLATSIVEITKLKFTDATGTAFVNGVNFQIVSADNIVDNANATLNGSAETVTNVLVAAPGNIDLPTLAPGGTPSTGGTFDGTLDLCVGSPCSQPDNEFTASIVSSGLGDPTTNLSFADELIEGAAIDFPNAGISAGAEVSVESTSMLIANGQGSATSDNGLIASYQFILAADSTFSIEFNGAAYMEAYVSSDLTIADGDDALAKAARNVLFEIKQGTSVIFSWNPDGNGGGVTGGSVSDDAFNLNDSISRDEVLNGAVSPDGVGSAQSGFFKATTVTLSKDLVYQLNATETTKVSVRQKEVAIPEPTSLALLGLGLIGFSFKKRRA